MPAANLNGLRLRRVEYDPYDQELEEDEEYDFDFEPDPDPLYVRTVDIEIIDQAEKQVGNARFWLIDRNDIVEQYGGDFVALLDERSSEASDFAVTLFDGRGNIQSVVREGKGVWGGELNTDPTIAYLQEIRVDEELRGQGIGSWVLRQLLTHIDVYLDGAQFIYTFPATLNSERPYPEPFASSDPYADEKNAMSDRLVEFYRRLGFRRLGTTGYFCCARSLTHPSRAVPANEDADRVEPAVPFAELDPATACAMVILGPENFPQDLCAGSASPRGEVESDR